METPRFAFAPAPSKAPGNRLTPSQRRALLDLIASRAGSTDGQLAMEFRDRTGLAVSRVTVRRARVLGYRLAVEAGPDAPKPNPRDSWPSWTDEVRAEIPWTLDDVIVLGPAAGPIG